MLRLLALVLALTFLRPALAQVEFRDVAERPADGYVARDVVVAPNGQVFASGQIGKTNEIVVARFEADGSMPVVDTRPSWIAGTTTLFGHSIDRDASTGQLLVAGRIEAGSFNQGFVMRYSPDLVLDTAKFGNPNGWVRIVLEKQSIEWETILRCVKVRTSGPQQRILLAGHAKKTDADRFDDFVIQLTETGAFDKSGFGTDGVSTTPAPSSDEAVHSMVAFPP